MKRNRIKQIFGFLITACLVIGITFASCAENEYSYTVTVLGGNCGVINGPTTVTVKSGEYWNPNDYTVTVTDDKYYFKGFHVSGDETIVGSMQITEDMVFVASYGVKGSTVAYTVRYVDENGNDITQDVNGNPVTSQSFYGNVGDEPVVAYIYIEGYMPNQANVSRPLSENEAENVFLFTYSLIPEPETTTPEPETTTPEPETTMPEPETTMPEPETTMPEPETTTAQQQGESGGESQGGEETGPGDEEAAPGGEETGPGDEDAGPGGEEAGPGDEEVGPGDEEAGPGDEEAGPGGEEAGPGGEGEDDQTEIEDGETPRVPYYETDVSEETLSEEGYHPLNGDAIQNLETGEEESGTSISGEPDEEGYYYIDDPETALASGNRRYQVRMPDGTTFVFNYSKQQQDSEIRTAFPGFVAGIK